VKLCYWIRCSTVCRGWELIQSSSHCSVDWGIQTVNHVRTPGFVARHHHFSRVVASPTMKITPCMINMDTNTIAIDGSSYRWSHLGTVGIVTCSEKIMIIILIGDCTESTTGYRMHKTEMNE
jgi:putative N-acetylmannosamine-6-phosphate epimerase